MTVYKVIHVPDPLPVSDWLQCDQLLCPVGFQTSQDGDIPHQPLELILSTEPSSSLLPHPGEGSFRSYTHSYEVSTQQGLESVICNIVAGSHFSAALSEPAYSRHQANLLEELEISFLCYQVYLEDPNIAVTTENTLITSSTGTSQQLLAFSQQLSENILNEAVQISSEQVECDLEDVRYSKPCAMMADTESGKMAEQSETGLSHLMHSKAAVDSCEVEKLIDIPVEVEAAECKAPCSYSPRPPNVSDLGLFKKIVLVEEVDQKDDSQNSTFHPHHVQQECIVEEMTRELSSSDNSASTPVDEPINRCTNPFLENIFLCDVSLLSTTADASDDVACSATSSANLVTENRYPSPSGVTPINRSDDGGQDSDAVSGCLNSSLQSSVSQTISRDAKQDATSSDSTNVNIQVQRDGIECLVERLLDEAFSAGFLELESVAHDVAELHQDYSPDLMESIRVYADNIVIDAYSSAMYQIRDYLIQKACCPHCRNGEAQMNIYMSDKALDREWNAQLTAFVDDFVLNIMEEALFIKKTTGSDLRLRAESKEKKHVLSEGLKQGSLCTSLDNLSDKSFHSTSDPDTRYFEAEFNVDFHNSLENQRHAAGVGLFYNHLHADPSSRSNKRCSYDDVSGHQTCQKNMTGFQDVMLSEFEEELIHSDLSTPCLSMFDDLDISVQRRASEPLGYNSDVLHVKDKKRARSVDSGASRQVILRWLDRQATPTLSNHGVVSRRRTSSSHLDWFAQDLLVEAFNDAFVSLFGPNYEGLQELMNKGDEQSTQMLTEFAEALSQTIFRDSFDEISSRWPFQRHPDFAECWLANEDYFSASDSLDEYVDALDLPLSQIEHVAEEFSSRILREALNIIRNDVISGEEEIPKMMNDDAQLGVLVQWAAATRAGVKTISVSTPCLPQLEELPRVVDCLRRHNYSVTDLVHLMMTYIEDKLDKKWTGTIFSYILHRLDDNEQQSGETVS